MLKSIGEKEEIILPKTTTTTTLVQICKRLFFHHYGRSKVENVVVITGRDAASTDTEAVSILSITVMNIVSDHRKSPQMRWMLYSGGPKLTGSRPSFN